MRIEDQSRWNDVDPAGHVAGEANHPKHKRTGNILGEIFDKIEGLLDLYVKEKSLVGSSRGEVDHATGPR